MDIKRRFLLDPSLVLYLPLWKLDGGSIRSDDAYGHLCSVTGALWRPYGRWFDRIDDVITVPTKPILDTASALTVLAWIKVVPAAGEVQGIVTKCSMAEWNVNGYTLRLTTTGAVTVTFTLAAITTGIGDVDDNAWHFVGFSWSKDGDGNIKVIVDNTFTASDKNKTTDIVASTDSLRVGTHYDGSTPYMFGGIIGEVWEYSRMLFHLETERIRLATMWRYR